jgi:3-oxoacyl-[acyl-carrier-protein] synthase-3
MTSSLPVAIAAVKKHVPARVVENAELEPLLGVRPGWILERTGIERRRWAAHDEGTVALGLPAVQAALDAAGVAAADLDLIIGACAVPQQALPSTSCFLAADLGVAGVGCFDVNASCFSFPLALWQGAQAIARGDAERVLVWSSEVSSRGVDLQQPASACLFGDGAGAAVLVRAHGALEGSAFHSFLLRTYPVGRFDAQIRAGGTAVLPDREGFDPRAFKFQMNGKAIFKHALAHAPGFLAEFFEKKSTIQQRDLKLVIPHQTNKHGIDAVSRWLGFADDVVFSNLKDHGNCVAAALPMALADALDGGRLRRGDPVMLCGTAAGLTLGALVLTW